MSLTTNTLRLKGYSNNKTTKIRYYPAVHEEVHHGFEMLRGAGCEACELIVGIDFTKSNIRNGQETFDGRCLHDLSLSANPYMVTLNFIARTLEVYDDDHLIPCYGFGDATTAADAVFSFYANNRPAEGLGALLDRYKEIASVVNMSGPTSFAPLIRQAMRDVYNGGMRFHVLLILADGQISQECLEDTKQAIVDACAFPLSIVMIGVGDGPWNEMKEFDEGLPERRWPNFQFFAFDEIFNWSPLNSVDAREVLFENSIAGELSDHYKQARGLIGEDKKAQVAQFVASISSDVVKDPPPHFG